MGRNTCLAVLCLLLIGVQFSARAERQTPKDNYILLLNSANFGESWSDVILESLQEGLSQTGMEVRTDILQVPKMKTHHEVKARQDSLLAKYPTPPRAVIFIGDPGWLITRTLFDAEWKGVPTLICYSREEMPLRVENLLSGNLTTRTMVPAREMTEGYNLTVLRQPSYVRETIQTMQRLLPQMQRVAFISDNRYISLRMREEVVKTVKRDFPELKLELLHTPEMTTEELLDKLAEYDQTVGLIYYSWFVTERRSHHSYLDDNIQKILYAFTRTPIFTLADRTTEAGDFAGGYYISASDFALEVIAVVREILSGRSARDIPWRDGGSPRLYLDYEHLVRHGVSPSIFPEEAVYEHVPPRFLEKYKYQVLSAVSFVLLVLIGGILWMRLLLLRQNQLRREYSMSAQYRRLVNNMPVIYISWRPLPESGDFVFLDVNTAFERAFGCGWEQVADQRLSDLQTRFETLRCLNTDSDAFTLKGVDGAQDRFFNRLVFSGSKSGVQDIFCIDRTEEHLVELQIAEHHIDRENLNERYKLVLRATGLTPWTWDKRTELIDCDFEFTPGDYEIENNRLIVPADVYYDLIHPEDRERIRQAYDDLHEGRSEILQQEYRVIYMPGTTDYHWVKSFAVVMAWDADRKPLSLVGASLQINTQKILEQDLREAKERAEESNRLKSAFLANMSHEIRTPLNAILGFSRLLIHSDDLAERNEFLRIVEENNDLLLKLVSDILDLSKIEAGTFQFDYNPLDVNQMCEEVIRSLSLKIQDNPVALHFSPHAAECVVRGDKSRLMQVLINFVNNALKFTHEGSVLLDYELFDGQIRFFVKDTGIGIPSDKQAAVFDRFVKLNSFAQGTGLGLSICKSIVEQMGGTIGVESEEGKGSTFWIVLPLRS